MLEHLNTIKIFLVTAFGGITGGIVNLLGGWTEDMTTLLTFMGVDFMLGLLIAIFWKKSNKSKSGSLNSFSAWIGLCRKGGALLVVLVAYRLDVTLGTNYIKTAVIMAFIANESISIIENLGIMGVPFPAALKKAVELLTNKSNSEGE